MKNSRDLVELVLLTQSENAVTHILNQGRNLLSRKLHRDKLQVVLLNYPNKCVTVRNEVLDQCCLRIEELLDFFQRQWFNAHERELLFVLFPHAGEKSAVCPLGLSKPLPQNRPVCFFFRCT